MATRHPAPTAKPGQGIALFAYALTGAALATLVLGLFETSQAAKEAAQDSPPTTPAGAASRRCPLSAYPEACDNCMLSSCLEACRSCADNASCLRLFDCMMACTDAACERRCSRRHPDGMEDLAAFLGEKGCLVRRCAAACP